METMEMNQSKVLNKLRAGKMVNCIKVNTYDHRVVEIAAMCGFDCIWSDLEHTPGDLAPLEKQILTAKLHGADTLVRVKRGSYSDHIHPLEMNAEGIMVPHVMNLEDAKRVVQMTRFHPVGRRAIDGGNADGAYSMIGLDDYIKQSNEHRFVIIQIEDHEALNDLDAICALDGLDVIFFGPGDFLHSIGAPGEWDHPEVTRVRKLIAETAVRHGKFAGTVCGDLSEMREWYDIGYRFICLGADVLGLQEYFKRLLKTFSEEFDR